VFLLKTYHEEAHVNVGSGTDIAIIDLAHLVCDVIGFNGEIEVDPTKPDGAPRKLMSSEKLAKMGWTSSIGLRDGIAGAYRDFLAASRIPA
jgi:GDP-L-fucose synthase